LRDAVLEAAQQAHRRDRLLVQRAAASGLAGTQYALRGLALVERPTAFSGVLDVCPVPAKYWNAFRFTPPDALNMTFR
jgi:hypothetical protein